MSSWDVCKWGSSLCWFKTLCSLLLLPSKSKKMLTTSGKIITLLFFFTKTIVSWFGMEYLQNCLIWCELISYSSFICMTFAYDSITLVTWLIVILWRHSLIHISWFQNFNIPHLSQFALICSITHCFQSCGIITVISLSYFAEFHIARRSYTPAWRLNWCWVNWLPQSL